tara:strand:+ start:8085 stop:8651 length:567 start_codon:yes stop_codon:yes gene_type:complete
MADAWTTLLDSGVENIYNDLTNGDTSHADTVKEFFLTLGNYGNSTDTYRKAPQGLVKQKAYEALLEIGGFYYCVLMKLFMAIKKDEYKVKRLFYIYYGFEQVIKPNKTQFLAKNPQNNAEMLFFHYNDNPSDKEVSAELCKGSAGNSPLKISLPKDIRMKANFIVNLEEFIQYYSNNAQTIFKQMKCQ